MISNSKHTPRLTFKQTMSNIHRSNMYRCILYQTRVGHNEVLFLNWGSNCGKNYSRSITVVTTVTVYLFILHYTIGSTNQYRRLIRIRNKNLHDLISWISRNSTCQKAKIHYTKDTHIGSVLHTRPEWRNTSALKDTTQGPPAMHSQFPTVRVKLLASSAVATFEGGLNRARSAKWLLQVYNTRLLQLL